MGSLVLARGLSAAQLEAVAALEAACAGDGRLKLEWPTLRSRPADEVRDVLWLDGGSVLGFLGLYRFGFGPLEITGMVHPQERRRGIGRSLLAAALELPLAQGAPQILLVVDRRSAAGVAFAGAAGGRLEHSEHFMTLAERRLPPAGTGGAGGVTLRPAGAGDGAFVARLMWEGFGVAMTEGGAGEGEPAPAPAEDLQWMRILEVDGEPVGTIRAQREDGAGYVAGFVVDGPLRGKGLGRAGLRLAVDELLAGGAWPVSLEVATDNDHALGLYLDSGFEVVSTMDYFELPAA